MQAQRGKSVQPFGSGGSKGRHAWPTGHEPPHIPLNVTTPHGRTSPVQPHAPPGSSGTHSRALAHNPKQVPPPPPQSGMPRLVVVWIGHDTVVVDVLVVDVVDGPMQQKSTSSGVIARSPGRHASRIFTDPFKVPSFRGLVQSTAPAAGSARNVHASTNAGRRRMPERYHRRTGPARRAG